MFSIFVLAAVSLHVGVIAQVVRVSTDGKDQLDQRSGADPVLRGSSLQTVRGRRLEEEIEFKEIELESDNDEEEQGADFDAQFSDLLQPLHNHHEFQDLLTGLHTENWADGCRDVFLDVGANQGTHIQMLFEPEKYGNTSALRLLEKYFGPASRRTQPSNESGLCAFGFEANPRFAEEHRKIESAYADRGWKVQFFTPIVVTDHDGAEDFYIQDSLDSSDLSLGSSIHDPSLVETTLHPDRYYRQELPSARFAELVRTKVADRMLSEGDNPGKVFMKMDIVGAEYAVLPDLLQAGVLCQQGGIDGMLVRRHTQSLKNVHENFTPWSELKEAISMQNGCKDPSELVEVDLNSTYIDTPQLQPSDNSTMSSAEKVQHSADLIV